MLALARIWESLASKIFHRWDACVWDVGALASESGGKLAVYRVLKDHIPAAKPYARANLPVWVQRVLAGLRAGCLPLQVELGQYTSPKTPLNGRHCKMYNMEVDKQEHFLLHCISLKTSRATLWAEISLPIFYDSDT